ncbi:MAG: CDP-glycerol glycerophosphotransferase family protein [Rhizobacter sp.]|nr:CDP-glycerol glycerophosphotransferase family protein [Rhizobacter sp.]
MRQGWHNLQAYLRFQGLPLPERRVVVYSEGAASWPHLGPVLRAALARVDHPIAYVSSSADDPGVALAHPRLSTHVIGDGHVRTLFFSGLQADLLLMTMPDLNTFHIKRSARTRHCAYLHHSLVSSHMAYREAAFDHFDTVLCAGPHHEAEIRAIEVLHGLPPKHLVPHGYGRLDAILAASHDDLRTTDRPVLLVAPSWGPHGLLEAHADELLRALAPTRWDVIVRPHPQTLRLAPQAIACVRQWCERSPNLRLETSVAGHESLRRASVMVSDWSGAAFDYALGLERPVLFIDVPRKVNNPRYQQVPLEPIEVFGREPLGQVVSAGRLAELPLHLERMLVEQAAHRDQIRAFRERWVFNLGRSAEAAADWLVQAARASP